MKCLTEVAQLGVPANATGRYSPGPCHGRGRAGVRARGRPHTIERLSDAIMGFTVPVGAGATGICRRHLDARFWEVEAADLQRIRRCWPDQNSESGIPGREHGAGKTRRERTA